ncbi:Similar to CWC27: Spliceosome-associated protein CWC27 homolog (Pongo abelii) [Cotesia congregata]|uniref:Similar to CWC27: Spliceosome-associated protein CWC27 homolog (Pongo abelii) n=1 Tax=Cotesia congregata TaxID=51543 RepID=A0A8J2HHF4_COTCN|nr:Similar to CWC27: Spliceosome-associated protein CWC27 homolog (Pongo abelii) [Cotesia congregata]
MSNIYIQEPPSTGKVLLKTSVGDVDIELWTKEAPKACRNFIQLCMEGYYDNTIFHRLVKGFIVQGGDPTGTGEGGESIYGRPFKDEFHTRLRFCRRGLVAMANAGKDDNGSQFFITLAATPEPLYPQKIIKTEVLLNPFKDIEPRDLKKKEEKIKEAKPKASGVNSAVTVEPSGPPSKKRKEDRSSDWESGDELNEEERSKAKEKAEEVKKRIMDKLKKKGEEKKMVKSKKEVNYEEAKEESSEEEYYIGKERDDERKKQAEAIKKEIRGLKRDVQREKKDKEIKEQQKLAEEQKKAKKGKLIEEFVEIPKYREAVEKIPLKGESRDSFTMQMLNKFKSKLQDVKESTSDGGTTENKDVKDDDDDDDDEDDESWMQRSLVCDDNNPTLAKDANTKNDDWFEIYDPRNPLNKRRRGETSEKKKGQDEDTRPRDWDPKKTECRGPLKIARLCILGIILPAALVAGPVYLRYRVYSEQLYPLAASDQRLIDARVSTTWCQKQVVKVNATFNAYLINGEPKIKVDAIPVSMTRHLVLEDDMKEYWGFYLLRGSSVTVSTCVRWPGASLTIIRGHKHLHECAFIGDDSSEELEELLEIAEERGILNGTGLSQLKKDNPSNLPKNMKRVQAGVQFHHQKNTGFSGTNLASHYNSHELDAPAMREILKNLFAKTLETKNKQKSNPHHHYEGVFRESVNIDRPPTTFDNYSWISEQLKALEQKTEQTIIENEKTTAEYNKEANFPEKEEMNQVKANENLEQTSAEVFKDILQKINSLGTRGRRVIDKLITTLDESKNETHNWTKMLHNVIQNSTILPAEKKRLKRQLFLSNPLQEALGTAVEDDEDAAVEEEDLNPDGIAEDRGSVNESTLNDRSNSEFWSSFSSSEERLLDCKGLILNLPLTPHHLCSPKYENQHSAASMPNAVTYRVPIDGYYFFVFSSENEIQPNYIRIQFDLLKTVYNTSQPIFECKNSTSECSLPFNFFSWERTVLELPVTNNDSQWNEEYVVVSQCEPRTAVYLLCIITVPLLILLFAFH